MKKLFAIGTSLAFQGVIGSGLLMATPNNDPAFEKRLSEVNLSYSLPTGFVDDGANESLEKELRENNDSVDDVVVHQIHSADGKIAAYIDVRVLGIDLNDPAFEPSYPIVFEANAMEYCAMVSENRCAVLTRFPKKGVQADYNADLGMVFMGKAPKSDRIGGHKKMSLVAISKPRKGLFFLTIAYDSDSDFEKNFEPLMYSLKFK